jgi:branched-subunit amino acid aminotransferase/4-amino-4-deoxychorismate lyase
MTMKQLCYLNDHFVPFEEARLHISDLGLQRGYGIFDYFLATSGRIPFYDDYLDRFYTSADRLNLKVPLCRKDLKETIAELLRQNGLATSGIKLLLTGGYSDDLYSPSSPNFMVLNLPVHHNPGEFGEGVKLILLDFQRHIPEVKTTFYLPSIALFPIMKAAGAIEVLYHHNGLISETTRANIFLIKNETLITPSPGVLQGITRKHVLGAAKDLLAVVEREVRLEEIWEADEVFITGTSKHVMPVVQIEGRKVGNGKPGLRTKAVSAAFEEHFHIHSV